MAVMASQKHKASGFLDARARDSDFVNVGLSGSEFGFQSME